jgi:AraC-like DNA-binding protein
MLTEYLKGSTILENSAPDEVSAYIRRHIGMHELTSDSRANGATLRHTTLGTLGLSVVSYGTRALVENPVGIDDYHLHLVVSGDCTISVDHHEVHLGPGWGMLVNPSMPSAVTYSPEVTKLIVNIPKSLFNACLLDHAGRLPVKDVRFACSASLLSARSTTFRAIELLYLEAEDRGDGMHLSVSALELFFASKLLEFFPNNVSSQVAGKRSDLFFGKVDRYIDTHVREDISAADLASECTVSLRTLYDRFAVHKGVSPSTYVKEKKLRRIYARLSNANVPTQSVTEVALEFGFCHLGRFSAEYKAMFGELPSGTFHRSRLPKPKG